MKIPRIIAEMQQSGQVVHVIPRRTALAFQKRGLVRLTVVSPAPIDGTAVNLTVIGKSLRNATLEPAHETQPQTE